MLERCTIFFSENLATIRNGLSHLIENIDCNGEHLAVAALHALRQIFFPRQQVVAQAIQSPVDLLHVQISVDSYFHFHSPLFVPGLTSDGVLVIVFRDLACDAARNVGKLRHTEFWDEPYDLFEWC
jgi:hypothetical protein